MRVIVSGKIHIERKDGKSSLCGQSPWTEPVMIKKGKFEEVTCKRCIKAYQK
ncbi:hypothetical protein ACSS31_28745 (plasmid) [Priestia megaterium]